ncbi:protein SCAI-like [Zingiber officinale]|uniref:protein SCAI-like n=1 Tax=Zingiber officinale TaxID=94328 RepID=UPI001C4D485D|nr:protein SCAI-like [Zingiber officinale]
MAQTSNKSSIPITELFWSLLDKADRKFSRVRDLPNFGRNRNDADFHKAFKIYTQLWKLQQEHRQKLVEAGLRRWEVGEIAARIAQLYYGQYQRTGDSSYLSEAYIFYEAIFSREYFRDGGGGGAQAQDTALANKQLRFLARFLIVCLVLGRREMVFKLVGSLKAMVDECKKSFQEAEFREWKHVVQEIIRFLKADTTFMNMRPLRYSFLFDSHPDSLPVISSSFARRGLVVRDAILCSYHHNEVKFTELTLDTFRMLQCLEWEPSGSFSTRNGTDSGHFGTGINRVNLFQDIRDQTLPPNPRKLILYRPSITHFLLVLATICEELPPDGIMLIYLSAAGGSGLSNPVPLTSEISLDTAEKIAGNFSNLEICSPLVSQQCRPTRPCVENKDASEIGIDEQASLWLGSRGTGGSSSIYPCDLIPFTRKPIFLVIDSDRSQAFKVIHGAEKGATVAMLLSPCSRPPPQGTTSEFARSQQGSQFTMFLSAPVQAFCFLIGISGANVDKDKYDKAEKLLSFSLSEWERALVTSNDLHPVWIEVLGDPFLRRLLLRFIFCRTALALYAPAWHHDEYLPECLPHLPEPVDPNSYISQSAIMKLADTFGIINQFVFSEEILLSKHGDDDSAMERLPETEEDDTTDPDET